MSELNIHIRPKLRHGIGEGLVLALAAGLSPAVATAVTEPIVLVSPAEYQVVSLSTNGKWATGVFTDYSYAQRGFLWNLESNTIELLSTTEESTGWSVANDGTVCGSFNDKSTSEIGAGTEMPGYYRDGEWHGVEIPQGFSGPEDNYHGAGTGYAISADGSLMAGALYVNSNFSPAVWRDGKLDQLLNISNNGMQGGAPYCISPDGTMVGGWAYRSNRSCAIWNLTNGTRQYISEAQGPWSSVNRFSPDGKKVLYGGGWDETIPLDSPIQKYYALYDVETGEATAMVAHTPDATVSLFGISGSYTCVGSTGDYDGGQAIVYPNGKEQGVLIEDYLADYDVDFGPMGQLAAMGYGNMTLFRAQDISADDNILALLGYSEKGELLSVIVMLNQDTEHAAPLEVKVRQLSGIPTGEIRWSAPVRATEAVKAYRVYRNDQLIAELGADMRTYYDPQLAVGSYDFCVSSVYEDGTEMRSATRVLDISPRVLARPELLTARQKGVFSIAGEWQSPGSNLVSKSWFTRANANLQGFGISVNGETIELAIGFDREEMQNYAGYQIRKVNFYPMSEQKDWKLNIYQYEGNDPKQVYSQPITQELVYRQRNTVVLDEPFSVPTDGDLVIAIEVKVPQATTNVIGMDYGHNTAGYSDLMRLASEPDFYSYYDMTQMYGVPDYTTFMIEAVLAEEGQDLSVDEVEGYILSLDGEEVLTTAETHWKSGKVVAGDHVLGVQAVFADGKVSDPAQTNVSVAYDYKAVEAVEIDHQGTELALSWQAPIDDDATLITYARGQAQSSSIQGPEENDYCFMAGVAYDQSVLSDYDGYVISSLRFYPIAKSGFAFLLYIDGEVYAEVPVEDYRLNQWNTIMLDEPIEIKAGSQYFLAMDCYDVEPDAAPLAIDNRLPLASVSDLYSLDGMNWSSITVDTGMSGNWMLGMNILEPDAEALEVEGYDVMLDNTKIGDKVAETSLTYDLGDKIEGKHNLRVNTYYPGRYASVKGSLITFYIDASGMRSVSEAAYRLALGTDVLCVEGAGVTSVEVLSVDGAVKAKAQGNKVTISSLPAGTYMVKAAASDRMLTYKLVIG